MSGRGTWQKGITSTDPAVRTYAAHVLLTRAMRHIPAGDPAAVDTINALIAADIRVQAAYETARHEARS